MIYCIYHTAARLCRRHIVRRFNFMKKLVSLVLALVLCFSFSVADEAPAFLGEWFLNTVVYKSFPVNATYFGMSMSLVFEADGSAITRLTGYTDIPGTWTLDGETLTVTSADGAVDAYTFDGESVTAASTDGMSMIYARTPAVKPVYGQAPVNTAATAEDFYGSWFCVASEAGGKQIPPVMAGMTLAMSIDAYDAACVFLVDEYNIGWVGGTGEVQDGQMVIDVTSAKDAAPVTLRIDTDGIIAYDEGEGAEMVTYYFQQTNKPVVE